METPESQTMTSEQTTLNTGTKRSFKYTTQSLVLFQMGIVALAQAQQNPPCLIFRCTNKTPVAHVIIVLLG